MNLNHHTIHIKRYIDRHRYFVPNVEEDIRNYIQQLTCFKEYINWSYVLICNVNISEEFEEEK